MTEIRHLILNRPALAWTHNGTWVVSSIGMMNAPVLGAELLTNSEFSTNTSGWTAINSAVLTRRDFTSSPNISPTGGSDNFGLEVASGGNSSGAARQQPAASVGAWIVFGTRAYSPSADTSTLCATITNSRSTVLEDVWEELLNVFRNTANPPALILRCGSATNGDLAYFDAPTAKTLTLSDLFIVRAGIIDPPFVSADVTLRRGAVAGVVVNLDSISNPQNFVVAYWDGLTVKMDKCVGGTYTQLVSSSVSNVDGSTLEIRKTTNTTYQCWLRGSQRGTDQTVSDAGIISNTLHGGFSTHSGNLLQNLMIG